jgi:hypothetical protein
MTIVADRADCIRILFRKFHRQCRRAISRPHSLVRWVLGSFGRRLRCVMTLNTFNLFRTIGTVILSDVIEVIEFDCAEFRICAQRNHLGRFLDVLNCSIGNNSSRTRNHQERKNKAGEHRENFHSSTPLQTIDWLSLKAPGRARMATLANRKIVAAKRTLTVVTSHTTLSPAGSVMISRFWRADLLSLRRARPHLVTLVAV